MLHKEEFYKEKDECKHSFYHIEEGITNSSLKRIDEIYGAADALSIQYSEKHARNLKITSVLASLLVFFFLLYEAAELHWMVFPCLIIIALLFYIYMKSKKQRAHEKFLEYRLVAETLRVHYFLIKSDAKKNVKEIIPWFLKLGVPLINEVLSDLPEIHATEKNPIIDCWIKDQERYHDKAHVRARKQKERDDFIERIVLIITILSYITAGIFELYMFFNSPFNSETMHLIHATFKIIIGTTTVISLFLDNYYGKISLSSKIEEHRRMSLLYQKAENKILQKGEESEELIIFLAREFLIENATWYAHQKENKIEFNIE